jgi:phosphopantothenoylcysteine decarboxylase/phosphopantothenate--cysteine ligase
LLLKDKKILLGVTGSIAVYKSIELVRRLVEEGASVHVIMTGASRNFITPLSFEAVSRNKVYSDIFDDPLSHITLTADADLMVVAPATANIIGKYSHGIADDMLTTCLLSFKGKVVMAPAMNWRMYENPIFRKNLDCLARIGVVHIGPQQGSLVCGEKGTGRMADIPEILEGIKTVFSKKDLAGQKVVVTAGPTREYLDPVRFISNRSSGKMGFAVARAAARRGANVALVSGPSQQKPASGVSLVSVETTADMRKAVLQNLKGCHIAVMTAAVADFSPKFRSTDKIEKSRKLTMEFALTPDILQEVCSMKRRPFVVGFAAETGDDKLRARKKLFDKGVDMIVFNNVIAEGSGFDVDTNEVTIIDKKGEASFPLMSKEEVADIVLDGIVRRIGPGSRKRRAEK